jgi:hypothetical protein
VGHHSRAGRDRGRDASADAQRAGGLAYEAAKANLGAKALDDQTLEITLVR